MATCARPPAGCGLLLPAAGGPSCPNSSSVWTTEEYDVLRTLGEGEYGAVVLARRRDSGETVAVKSLHAAASADEKAAAEIMKEATFLHACSGHPSIVALKAVAVHPLTGELAGLVMEYVHGRVLFDVLQDGGPLPEAAVRRIMLRLLSGAQHMHARRVVHRDLKMENILVAGGGGEGEGGFDLDGVKICDLGLAMSLEDSAPHRPVGTPQYMAPEILLGKPDYDESVDIWSLGCVMAVLLGGKYLFDGKDRNDLLPKIFHVLGISSYSYWPSGASRPRLGKVTGSSGGQYNHLREIFPKTILSDEGFRMLKGLLSYYPDERPTAAKALDHPWFKMV